MKLTGATLACSLIRITHPSHTLLPRPCIWRYCLSIAHRYTLHSSHRLEVCTKLCIHRHFSTLNLAYYLCHSPPISHFPFPTTPLCFRLLIVLGVSSLLHALHNSLHRPNASRLGTAILIAKSPGPYYDSQSTPRLAALAALDCLIDLFT